MLVKIHAKERLISLIFMPKWKKKNNNSLGKREAKINKKEFLNILSWTLIYCNRRLDIHLSEREHGYGYCYGYGYGYLIVPLFLNHTHWLQFIQH